MSTIKQVVESLVAAGTPLSDIIRQVNVAAVDKALVMNYGNRDRNSVRKCPNHRPTGENVMTTLSELKARNEFYKKGSIVPQRVLKTERKKKHYVLFGSDTWIVPTKSGYLCICDTGEDGSALKFSHKLKNATMVGSPYGGTTQWLGNTNRTDYQHESDVLNQLAKMEKKS